MWEWTSEWDRNKKWNILQYTCFGHFYISHGFSSYDNIKCIHLNAVEYIGWICMYLCKWINLLAKSSSVSVEQKPYFNYPNNLCMCFFVRRFNLKKNMRILIHQLMRARVAIPEHRTHCIIFKQSLLKRAIIKKIEFTNRINDGLLKYTFSDAYA